MRALLLGAILIGALPAQAAIYKCSDPSGKVVFSDKPCGGAVESPEHQIKVTPQARQEGKTNAQREAEWEEQKRYRYVEVPRIEREAQALMDSGEPQQQEIGREMAWQARQAKEAFGQIERARAAQAETSERYKRALKQIGGY